MGSSDGLPDAVGVPEFFISEVETEIIGPNIRVLVGCRKGGKIDWLYSAVMQAEEAIPICEQVIAAAQEAIRRMQRKHLRVVDH